MAVAMLASRNEPYWGDPKVYMSSRKTPNPNILTNPNPSSSNKRYEHNLTIEPADPRLASSSAAGGAGDAAAAAAAAASDDDSSSSLKPPPLDLGRRREAGAYVTYKISNYSKKELRELKRRLICELDLVRSVASRIEAREQQLAAGRSSAASSKKIPPTRSETTVIKPKKPPPRPSSAEMTKLTSAMMKRCGQILTKLTKHAGAVWFNSPVDVVALNLPDYHRIIKNPMDLGTVKSKLNKNLYSTPSDLAADIRLTFNNALTYNPPGHVVYNIAKQLLTQFETSFGPAYHKYEKHLASLSIPISRKDEDDEEDEWRPRDISSWSQQPHQVPLPEINKFCVEPPTHGVAPPSHPIDNRPSPPMAVPPSSKHHHQMMTMKPTVSGKQPPKPKAKDQNKRPMTMDEKEKLTHALQDLPSDKMPQLLLIIQKRNAANLQAGGDEVELDFELMDNETLWELDRFVTNIKKSMSKVRKQQEAMSGQGTHLISAPTSDPTPAPLPHHAVAAGAFEKSLMAADEIPGATAAKKSKKLEPAEEDVDIGEGLPVTIYPSVDIVKDTGCHSSSSSSSSSGSSSSSDSDSGSSSGSDSDDDGGQSPVAAGSRPLPGN